MIDEWRGECSDISDAASDVVDFAIRDRVFMMVAYCSSHRVITLELVAKISDGLSLEAATVSITFVTMLTAYSLPTF